MQNIGEWVFVDKLGVNKLGVDKNEIKVLLIIGGN